MDLKGGAQRERRNSNKPANTTTGKATLNKGPTKYRVTEKGKAVQPASKFKHRKNEKYRAILQKASTCKS